MYTTEYYSLLYDSKRNQINWTVKKPWMSAKVAADVLAHWDRVLAQARKPGFKVLADMTEMRAESRDVEAVHKEIQQKIMQAGVGKIATVISKSAVALLAGKNVGGATGVMKVAQNFKTTDEAQAWLDE